MKSRTTILFLSLFTASLSYGNPLVCSISGGTVELCGAAGFQITMDLSRSGVTLGEIGHWTNQQYTLPQTGMTLFTQSITFSGLRSNAGSDWSMGWGVSYPSGVTGALGYILDGQIGVLGVLTGGPSSISGQIRVSGSTPGTHSFGLGVIEGTRFSVSLDTLLANQNAAPTPVFTTQLLVDPVGDPVPEPSTLALTSGLLAAIVGLRRR